MLEKDRSHVSALHSLPVHISGQHVQETYGEFYSTNIFGQNSVDVIEAHNPANGPLFLYAAFTAGHSPLQALDIDFAGCDPAVRIVDVESSRVHIKRG